jgi:riboflavin transporter FmnP
MKTKLPVRMMASITVLSAVSFVLSFLEFPVLLSPSFARMDLSDFPALIASFGEFIPFIKTKLDVVLYNAFPFNLLKGLVITAFTMLVYKLIRPLLKGKD